MRFKTGRTGLKRHLFMLVALITMISGIVIAGPMEARAGASLDGRLGGRLASFEDAYGQPVSGTPEQGADFKVPGFGTVFVQFKLANDPTQPNRIIFKTTPKSPAIVIAVSAPRDVTASATAPDPNDWSLAEAEDAVRTFLPEDVDLGQMEIDGQAGSAVCTSPSFVDVFPGATNTCRIGYVLPTADTVSYATLVLAPGEGGDDGPRNPCMGLAAWSADVGSRLTAAQGFLEELGSVDDTAPDAVEQLTQIGSSFTTLADEQRGAETPAVAGRVRDLLVDAFTSYAQAAQAAADGVESKDETKIDAAVELIGSAETSVSRATALLQRAANECGLGSATPVAGDAG